MAIVNSSKWREAMMNEMPDLHNSGRRITPMRKLIMKMPGTNRCLDSFINSISVYMWITDYYH